MRRSTFHDRWVGGPHRVPRRRGAVGSPHSRPLRFEPLEDRRLLSITVDTLADENDGIGFGHGTSLRDAIAAAAPGATIDFSVTGTIQLTLGELAIDKDLTISGPGAGLLVIDAGDGTDGRPGTGDGTRIFNIDDANSVADKTVEISGLTIAGGDMPGYGGAIFNAEALSVTDCEIHGNSAVYGGALCSSGTMAIVTSTIHDNSADYGGGIYNYHADLTVTASTIRDNSAAQWGGGIYNSGTAAVLASTINDNSADVGGGIANDQGTVTVTISTISQNLADYVGGGIYTYYGSVSAACSTIAGNWADADGDGSGNGGGLYVYGITVSLDHTIVAGNFMGLAQTPQDISNNVSAHYCLIGINTGATITDRGGNQVGSGTPIDPLLGPLQDNGGPTWTHALLSDSLALDAGQLGFTPPATTDQRGWPFHRVDDAVGIIDIGAYERQSPGDLPDLTVSTLEDESDGDYSAGDLSLREAIGLANGNVEVSDVVHFDPTALDGGTIDLRLGELRITEGVTIDGRTGLTAGVTIDAGNGTDGQPGTGDGFRVFNIDDGEGDNFAEVFLNGLALTGGDVGGTSGGAIRSTENLTLIVCTVEGNSARIVENVGGYGGAILSYGGHLSVAASTFSGNSADFVGGAIANYQGVLSVDNSTICDNTAYWGGGIANWGGNLAVTDSDIRDNMAGDEGGGIYNDGTASIIGSVIAGNSALLTDPEFGYGMGGGISSSGSLTITASTIRDNLAEGQGAGIYTNGESLSISGSTISDNSANAAGGGILCQSANLTITACTIDGNAASSGGGIAEFWCAATVTGSTISNNSAVGDGGGIAHYNLAELFLTASTISNNSAGSYGGGIYNYYQGETNISFSTITENQAPDGHGAGVASRGHSDTLNNVYCSIIAGNLLPDGVTPGSDVDYDDEYTSSFTSLGYNLIGTGSAVGAFSEVGDQTGVDDPGLGLLQDNGGPTWTHALAPGSPAIDAGGPPLDPDNLPPGIVLVPKANGQLPDQRGFDRACDGDGDGAVYMDIGAFEAQAVLPPIAGDYSRNGVVDAADYTVWRDTLLAPAPDVFAGADGNGNGLVDEEDLGVWKANFGNTASSPGAGSAAEAPLASPPPLAATLAAMVAEPPLNDATSAAAGETALPATRLPIGGQWENFGLGAVRGQEAHAQLQGDRGPCAQLDSNPPSAIRHRQSRSSAAIRDDLLVAWLATRDGARRDDAPPPTLAGFADDSADLPVAARDSVFEVIGTKELSGILP